MQHAYSLLTQHLNFSNLQKEDDFIRRYMNYLGHNEFGLSHKSWNKPVKFKELNDSLKSNNKILKHYRDMKNDIINNSEKQERIADIDSSLDVLLTDIKRIPPSSVDPTIKNYHWMDLVTGMLNAYEKGNDTAILVDENNNITEGPGFNLFCVDENGVFTPDHGVLEGITRQTVFDLAKELNITISKKPISIEQLKSAKELFATSTAGGVMPITKVSGNKINFGKVGNITRQIHKLYWEKHSAKDWSESVDSILN